MIWMPSSPIATEACPAPGLLMKVILGLMSGVGVYGGVFDGGVDGCDDLTCH